MTMFFSKKEFDTALRRAPPHTDIIYHSGSLARDRLADKEVDRVAKAAWGAMMDGKCVLYQRRIGTGGGYGMFDYIATKLDVKPVRWRGCYGPSNTKLYP